VNVRNLVTDKSAFDTTEWDELLLLPWLVIDGASAAQADGALGTAAENEVGLVSIARGRELGSPFVANIAEELTYNDPPQRDKMSAPDLVTRCRELSLVLGAKADQGDADVYRKWLVSIAENVSAAARSGGLFGLRTDVTDVERQFVDELGTAPAG